MHICHISGLIARLWCLSILVTNDSPWALPCSSSWCTSLLRWFPHRIFENHLPSIPSRFGEREKISWKVQVFEAYLRFCGELSDRKNWSAQKRQVSKCFSSWFRCCWCRRSSKAAIVNKPSPVRSSSQVIIASSFGRAKIPQEGGGFTWNLNSQRKLQLQASRGCNHVEFQCLWPLENQSEQSRPLVFLDEMQAIAQPRRAPEAIPRLEQKCCFDLSCGYILIN